MRFIPRGRTDRTLCSLYDVKQPKIESEMNLEILELMDKKYTERSDYGSG